MSSKKEFDLFFDLFREWGVGLHSAIRRFLAIREGSKWQLRFGSTVFHNSVLDREAAGRFNFQIKTDTVHAGRIAHALLPAEIPAVIDSVQINPSRLYFEDIDLQIDPIWPNSFSQYVNLVEHPRFTGLVRWPEAANYKISVVALEQILDLIQSVETPPKPSDLFSLCQKHVPTIQLGNEGIYA